MIYKIIKHYLSTQSNTKLMSAILNFSTALIYVPYFTAEAPTYFDSYNQPGLRGGRLFEHTALNRGSALLSQLAPCCPIAV